MKPNLRRAGSLIALCLMLIVAGCAASRPVLVDARGPLPVPPSLFGKSVAIPEPHAKESAKGYAARTLGALSVADGRLGDDAAFYADVQSRFGASKSK